MVELPAGDIRRTLYETFMRLHCLELDITDFLESERLYPAPTPNFTPQKLAPLVSYTSFVC